MSSQVPTPSTHLKMDGAEPDNLHKTIAENLKIQSFYLSSEVRSGTVRYFKHANADTILCFNKMINEKDLV